MKTHRKITGRTADGVPISSQIAPSRELLTPDIPEEKSILGSSSHSRPKQTGIGLDDRVPAHERISGK